MRKYEVIKKEKLKNVFCNMCGKQLKIKNGIVTEGVMSLDLHWGYFSEKDGQIHSFDLCEECYDMLLDRFSLPVAVTSEKEFL